MNSHRIDRIVFELALDDHSGARALQERISAFCRARLPAVLSEALRGFDADPRALLIKRIELDLGALTAATSDNALAYKLGQALEASLRGAAARHARQAVAFASPRAKPGLAVPGPPVPEAPQTWYGQETPTPVPAGVAFHVPVDNGDVSAQEQQGTA